MPEESMGVAENSEYGEQDDTEGYGEPNHSRMMSSLVRE